MLQYSWVLFVVILRGIVKYCKNMYIVFQFIEGDTYAWSVTLPHLVFGLPLFLYVLRLFLSFIFFSMLSSTKCSFYPNSQSPYLLFTSTVPSSGKLNMDTLWPEAFFMHPMLLVFSIFLWVLQPSGSMLCPLFLQKHCLELLTAFSDKSKLNFAESKPFIKLL